MNEKEIKLGIGMQNRKFIDEVKLRSQLEVI
jgi:hypothetical protein